MNKVQQFLNFSNSDGEVKTFFGGRLTLSQLICIILAVVIVIVVLKLLKGLLRIALTVTTLIIFLLQFGLASPTQLGDITKVIAEEGISAYNTYAKNSDNIKLQNNKIMVRLNDNWYSVNDIDSIVSTGDDSISITINGKSYATRDKTMIKLLNVLSSK